MVFEISLSQAFHPINKIITPTDFTEPTKNWREQKDKKKLIKQKRLRVESKQ